LPSHHKDKSLSIDGKNYSSGFNENLLTEMNKIRIGNQILCRLKNPTKNKKNVFLQVLI